MTNVPKHQPEKVGWRRENVVGGRLGPLSTSMIKQSPPAETEVFHVRGDLKGWQFAHPWEVEWRRFLNHLIWEKTDNEKGHDILKLWPVIDEQQQHQHQQQQLEA